MTKPVEHLLTEMTDAPFVDSGSPIVAKSAEASRLARHILNTFHSARKAFADDRIEERLIARFRRIASQNDQGSASSVSNEMLDEFVFNGDSQAFPEVVVRYEGSGPVRVILEKGSLRVPEGAHALVADLWYAAPDWDKSYPEAVRHASVQLPPDADMAAFEFFPEKTAHSYIVVAGLRWHLDFRHRDNFSRQQDSFNAVALLVR